MTQEAELSGPPVARSLDDITPEWLTAALAARTPGVRVTAVEQVEIIAATATKARLRLTGTAPDGDPFPGEVVVKGGLFGHDHERDLWPLYHNETIFYRDVAPQLPVEVPVCHAAVADESNGLVVLEDLTGAGVTFGAGRHPLSPSQVADGLDYQARFHAPFWGRASEIDALRLLDLRGFLTAVFDGSMASHFTIEERGQHDESTLKLVREAQEAASDRQRFAEAVLTVWDANTTSVPTTIHFDAHIGNMYLDREGAPHWLDWQACGRGSWAWDLAYFMVGALTPADRRAHERDLVDHYLDRLRAQGVEPPTSDEAWLAYRRNAIWGLCWTMVPDVMQSSEDTYPMIVRYLLAIRELDTMQALGLPGGGLWSM